MAVRVLKAADEWDQGGSLRTSDRPQARAAGAFEKPRAGAAVSPTDPFLRIPPFPKARSKGFGTDASVALTDRDHNDLTARIRELRVGGSYWGAQPDLPAEYLLVRSPAALGSCPELTGEVSVVFWPQGPAAPARAAEIVISDDCDPWHMLAGATGLVTEPGDEVRAIAACLCVPVYTCDEATGGLELQLDDARSVLAQFMPPGIAYSSPFDDHALTAREAVELCGFWRRLIDSNRELAGGLGFAFWKQENVSPLLWNGSRPFPFLRTPPGNCRDQAIAVWRSKTSPEAISMLEEGGARLIEVEDGFLRSQGLGADCVPPLSITVDRLGAYFDPSQASELELLLQSGTFDDELLTRARRLRRLIVNTGLGKYGCGVTRLERPAGDRLHILVPGQVEDDRAVQTGGSAVRSNLELLRRVRERSPDAYIIYKPHPDVLAGHRSGAIPRQVSLDYADEMVTEASVSSLVEMVDEVHVNTSLTGFEALMRDKPVTTHGAPFYAGWGLTHDLGPVPPRRTARRTIDELVAAVLLLYPRYLDPVTGLPCPAEVVVSRLAEGMAGEGGLIVTMRRLQGKLMRGLRRWGR